MLSLIVGLLNSSVFTSFSVLIDSDNIKDDATVKESEKWASYEIYTEIVVYALCFLINFNKKRKRAFVTGEIFMFLTGISIVVGYTLPDLRIARLCNILVGVGYPLMYGTLFTYLDDLLPHNLHFIGIFFTGLLNLLTTFAFPRIANEYTTPHRWLFYFAIYSGIALLIIVLSIGWLKETYGLNRK
jgi:MFS family permease